MWWFFCKEYKSFPNVFRHNLCHSLLLSHVALIFLFLLLFLNAAMIIVDMRAFSGVPETNMSTAKSISICFPFPTSPIYPTIMLLPPTCYFIHYSYWFMFHKPGSSHFLSLWKYHALICCYSSTTTFPLPTRVITSFQIHNTFIISGTAI